MALITEQLAEFVAMARPQELPENVLDRAILSTLDCIAAAIGGVPTANAASMRAAATRIFGGGPARAWFTDSLSMPAAAILANEYPDVRTALDAYRCAQTAAVLSKPDPRGS